MEISDSQPVLSEKFSGSILEIFDYLKNNSDKEIEILIRLQGGKSLSGNLSVRAGHYVLTEGNSKKIVDELIRKPGVAIFFGEESFAGFREFIQQKQRKTDNGRRMREDAIALGQIIKGLLCPTKENKNTLPREPHEVQIDFFNTIIDNFRWEKNYLNIADGKFWYLSLRGDPEIYKDPIFHDRPGGFSSIYENPRRHLKTHILSSRDARVNTAIVTKLIADFELNCALHDTNRFNQLIIRIIFEERYGSPQTLLIAEIHYC